MQYPLKSILLKSKKIFLSQYQNYLKLKTKIALFFIIAFLLIFALMRLAFCIAYPEVFSSLSLTETIWSFLYGIRFDAATIGLFLGYFIVLIFASVGKKQKLLIKIFTSFLIISSFLIILLALGDFFFFIQVKRHMGEELIFAWIERDFIVRYALSKYWHILILLFAGFFASIKLAFNFINSSFAKNPEIKTSLIKSVLIFLLSVFILILAIRGKIDNDRPLNTNDVYSMVEKPEAAQLALNGVFTQYISLSQDPTKNANNYPTQQAFQKAQDFILSANEFVPDEKYPLMRQLTPKDSAALMNKPNIVIVLLESWNPLYIDALNEQSSQKYGVTPNFDDMVKDAIVFTNAYANGRGSKYGLSASLTGISLLPGMVISHSIETMSNKTAMPQNLKDMGYWTMFAQSDNRSSMMMVDLAKNMLKADESYGLEDMPMLKKYLNDIPTGYDYELFDFASKKASKAHKDKKPFFIYLFTGTTHVPFFATTKEFEKKPYGTTENNYLNTLYYADFSIGQMLKTAKEEGWLDNTIFIFMADHTQGYTYEQKTIKDSFNIPFIIYAPKLLKAQKINWTISQADLIPTIYHLLNIQAPFSALGTNALDKTARHFALLNDGSNIIIVENGDYIRHNREQTIDSSLEENNPKYKDLQETLLFLDKALIETLRKNIWYKN